MADLPKTLQIELAELIQGYAPVDGLNQVMPGVDCIKFSAPDPLTRRYWHASLGIVAQGVKDVGLGQSLYRFGEAHYIATPVDLPVTSQIHQASVAEPYLCLRIDFDAQIVSELAAQMQLDPPVPSGHAIFVNQASDYLLAAGIRLLRLLERPQDVKVLSPLVLKEIFYHLLQGPDGAAILQLVRAGGNLHAIYSALYNLRARLDQDLDVDLLAHDAQMSRSAFFRHFRTVTSMSPVQYQKRLRLLEARRLMLEDGENAERSAFRVGYRSASQFSREYSRLFGNAPWRETRLFKEQGFSLRAV